MRIALVGALLVWAMPAGAQDAEAALAAVSGCLGTAERGEECRGVYARQCAAEAPGGASTVGMSACAAAETEAWDRLLNEVYAELVILSKRRAMRDREEGLEPPPLEGMLRDAQRAWIAFRDADCAHDAAIWGGDSQRQVAAAVCELERTATRVLELRGKRAQMQAE